MADLNRLKAALGQGEGSSDFDLNPDLPSPKGDKLRPAGVLIPVQNDRVLLTKRASHLKHHPGQIAFPGGKQDQGDADIQATALREAHEEIGLTTDNVDVIGTLPFHQTVTGFAMTPVVGIVKHPFDPVVEVGEVEEVFSVPLSHITNPENFRIESRRWQGVRRHYYTVPFGPYYIWGATARVLKGLAERMES